MGVNKSDEGHKAELTEEALVVLKKGTKRKWSTME